MNPNDESNTDGSRRYVHTCFNVEVLFDFGVFLGCHWFEVVKFTYYRESVWWKECAYAIESTKYVLPIATSVRLVS